MITLLQSKGYEGEDSLEPIIDWLLDKGIHPQFDPVWEDEELIGYRAVVWIPPYKSMFASPTFASYRDALASLLYNIKDYIC